MNEGNCDRNCCYREYCENSKFHVPIIDTSIIYHVSVRICTHMKEIGLDKCQQGCRLNFGNIPDCIHEEQGKNGYDQCFKNDKLDLSVYLEKLRLKPPS